MASLVVSGDTSGAITIAAPAVAGTNTLTLPASTGTLVVTGGAQTIEFADGTVSAPSITNSGDTNTGIFFPAADTIAFAEGGVESMRITSAGAVLIGTTSTATSSTLNIDSAGYQPLYVNTTISGGGGAAFSRSGTQALYTGTAGSSWLTGSSTADGLIRSEANMLFAIGNIERMRITSGGYLKASNNGTYTNVADTYHELYNSANNRNVFINSPDTNLTTDGIVIINANRNTTNNTFYALSYYNSGAGAFKLIIADSGNVTNTNGTYGTISDIKNKENIVDATPKLDKVNQLKVRNYNFIGDDLKQIGFVAQEFEQVFPSMVEEHHDKDADGNDLGTTTKSIKTSVLVPILVKAIQEQQQIINDLKARIETLENT
jgi:hypothetical protein